MKTLTFTLIFAIFTFNIALAQTVAPEKVSAAFKNKYSHAHHATWEKKSNGMYIAKFHLHGKHAEAQFDPTGIWKETCIIRKAHDLSPVLRKSIQVRYPEHQIQKVNYIEAMNNVHYTKVVLSRANEEVVLHFDLSGTLLPNADKANAVSAKAGK
jgi:hypothetical protein